VLQVKLPQSWRGAGVYLPSLTDARSNAEFIDEMIADPVFADMLADPGPEAEQSDDAAPNSHLHSHDHAGGPSRSHSQPHTHTHSQSHTHSHSLPQPHAHSHSQPHPQAHSHTTTPTPTSSSSPRPRSSQGENDLAQDKVRSTLRSFVRDWSVEGASERKACYDPCLEALERHFPVVPGGRDRGEVKVLVPGCGLGRLAMEIAARGESRRSKQGVAIRRS
jgi:carnosine N-methyltransferase